MTELNADKPAQKAEETTRLSHADEVANIFTHGAGFALSLAVTWFFYRQTTGLEIGLRVTCLVFCLSMAAVYLCSTLSHAVFEPAKRNRLRAWDQGTIYLLIIGTYSPFIWQGTDGVLRVSLLTACWLAALLGFYSKVLMTYRINAVATLTYLALGWLPAIPLIKTTPTVCVMWMILGGICYSLGVVFLKLSQRIRFSHAVWHLMVMLGSSCHVYAIFVLLEFARMAS